MLRDTFRTPGRNEISNEADEFAAHLDRERLGMDYDAFMDRIEREHISQDLAILALKKCSGNFNQAYIDLHPGADPAIVMWRSSGANLVDSLQQDTSTL